MDKEAFYLNQPEPNQSCFLALRQLILNHDKQITETVKYGMPCFCLGKRHFCYLWKDKKTQQPYLLMVDGNKLNHEKLVTGTRKRMKIYWVHPEQDIKIQEVKEILEEALSIIVAT